MHGTRGTTGSEGFLLLYSAVGNSLIFPISFALLPKFDAGKPGSETGINLKAGMWVKYMGSKSWLAPHVDRLLGDVAVLHSPFFGSGKLEYYLATRRPEGARRRRLRARRKPAPLLLEARPGLPALLAAPGGAQGGQALLLQSPPAGHSERPRRAPGRLLVRPAAQQLLGKVGLLHTAAVTGAEQRAASAAATAQCDRAMSERTGLSTRSVPPGAPTGHICRSSLHLPGRSRTTMAQGGGGMTWPSTRAPRRALRKRSALRPEHKRRSEAWELHSRAGFITRLCSGKNGSKPERW